MQQRSHAGATSTTHKSSRAQLQTNACAHKDRCVSGQVRRPSSTRNRTCACCACRFGKFSEELVRNYTRQLLLGLEYLHGSRVCHRDLKGGNVLVTRDGVVKLAGGWMGGRVCSWSSTQLIWWPGIHVCVQTHWSMGGVIRTCSKCLLKGGACGWEGVCVVGRAVRERDEGGATGTGVCDGMQGRFVGKGVEEGCSAGRWST